MRLRPIVVVVFPDAYHISSPHTVHQRLHLLLHNGPHDPWRREDRISDRDDSYLVSYILPAETAECK
jgi:hypothetical protein